MKILGWVGLVFVLAFWGSGWNVRAQGEEAGERAAAVSTTDVIVYVKAGTDLTPYMTDVLVRPFVDPWGRQAVFGKIAEVLIPKVAALAEVSSIREAGNGFLPGGEVIEEPEVVAGEEFFRRISLADQTEVNVRSAPEQVDFTQAGREWWDVEDSHKARAAWAEGYTGEGVRVMANDSGIDFCHPDLYGTWAVVTDPASPYLGWPMMFDAYSMQLLAEDQQLGTSHLVQGDTDYADTSATCLTAQPCTYKPIGAAAPIGYTLPITTVSASGTYHIGSHPDRMLQGLYGNQRVAVLLVDAETVGEYDTVYVDLDNDKSFADETPATREEPAACLDFWHSANAAAGADGYNDLSGGLVYFIADGVNPVPASDWMWGGLTPGNGDLVAFSILHGESTSHGQWTSTHVAGQGVVNYNPPAFKPTYNGKGSGMALGTAPGAGLVANGNFYNTSTVEDGFLFAALGYDGTAGTADDIQVVNNSWGDSNIIDKGWDDATRMVEMVSQMNPKLAIVFATGNGGPGYGTTISPTPPSGLSVGASGLYGSYSSFDSIQGTGQIRWGDYAAFSNRGARLMGSFGVDILANGIGYSATTLNGVKDGWKAILSWRGTSKSAPVTAGAVALVYDAYHERTGVYPDAQTAFAIIKAAAEEAGNDPLSQGAGYLDALAAVKLAEGEAGVYVLPTDWAAGAYRGENSPAFSNILFPGESATQVFSVTNPTASQAELGLSATRLVRMGEEILSFTTQPMAQESASSAVRPDYLIEITNLIPAGAELMEVRMVYPYAQFDPEQDYAQNQVWDVQVLDWTDTNGNGRLWLDTNANGVVNTGEMDPFEHMRFEYDYNVGNSLLASVRYPQTEMHDGAFLAFRHSTRSAAIPTTTMKIEVIFYQEEAWPWVEFEVGEASVEAGSSTTVTATLTVPAGTPFGMYSGFVRIGLNEGNRPANVESVRVPIIANVAAQGSAFTVGGTPPAETPFDNGFVGGYLDWAYRAEVGDWRQFFFDAATLPGQTARLLVHSDWEDPLPNDLDTYVYSPHVDDYSRGEPGHFGPYTLQLKGASKDMFVSGGKWKFNTVGAGTYDWVDAPLVDGLNLLVQRQVIHAGAAISVPFTTTVGTLSAPEALVFPICEVGRSAQLTVTHTLPLDGLQAQGFGFGELKMYAGNAAQDDPANPATASYTLPLTITAAGQVVLRLAHPAAVDLDLYLLYDANESGTFDWNTEIVAAEVSAARPDWVTYNYPENGDYLVAVHGAVTGGTSPAFTLSVSTVSGNDLVVSGVPLGVVTPGQTTLGLDWTEAPEAEQVLRGMVSLGTPTLPDILQIPVFLLPCDGLGYLPAGQFAAQKQQADPMAFDFTTSATGLAALDTTLNFGDGTEVYLDVGGGVSHTYALPGPYTVTLTVKNDIGTFVTRQQIWVGYIYWIPWVAGG